MVLAILLSVAWCLAPKATTEQASESEEAIPARHVEQLPYIIFDSLSEDEIEPNVLLDTFTERPVHVFFLSTLCPHSTRFVEQELLPLATQNGLGTDRPLIVALFPRDEWSSILSQAVSVVDVERKSHSEVSRILDRITALQRRATDYDAELGLRFFDPEWVNGNILTQPIYLGVPVTRDGQPVTIGNVPSWSLPGSTPSYLILDGQSRPNWVHASEGIPKLRAAIRE